MELTEELIKFCCKNLVQLDRLRGSDDWDVQRRAESRMEVFRNGASIRLRRLGLPNPGDIFRFGRPSLAELEQALRAMQTLAEDGSLDALEDLAALAMIAAKCVRNVNRMLYTREHQKDLPWHRKAAEQHGVVATPLSPDQIEDADINKMLRGLEKRITGKDRKGREQEGLDA